MDSVMQIENTNPLIDFSNSNLQFQPLENEDNDDVNGDDFTLDNNHRVGVEQNTDHVQSTRLPQLSREEQISVEKFKDYRSGHDYVLLLASTYINEAVKGRNGYFISEPQQLKYMIFSTKKILHETLTSKIRLYHWYNHKLVRAALFFVIIVNLSLIFFEEPAVYALPYWMTMLIELTCMFGYFLRLVHAWQFMPPKRHWKDKKIYIVFACILVANLNMIILTNICVTVDPLLEKCKFQNVDVKDQLTLVDMGVTLVLKQVGVEKFAIRYTRVLRPAFMVNFSETRQVRRTVRNIRRTIPEISSVLILFLLVIALYSLLGLKLFEHRNLFDIHGRPYFTDYWDIYFNLYVLTTTANNPDIMIPAYNRNNWFSLFFIVFTIICMYIFVSIFLAVVYKNYRTHLKNEVKASVYRKRRNMKSAFDVLKEKKNHKWVVTFSKWKKLIHYMKPKMNPIQVILFWRVLDEEEEHAIEFKNFVHLCDLLHVKMDTINTRGHIFLRCCTCFYKSTVSMFVQKCVKHRFFRYFFDLVIIANAVSIALNEENSELVFVGLFNLEILLKLYTVGPREFCSKFWNVFDTIVIGSATLLYILEAVFQVLRYSQFILDFLLILRVLRLFKIIGNIKRFQVIINTILQIGPAIITYGGIMFVLYYVYAVIGMELFQHRVHDYGTSDLTNLTELQFMCGNTKLNGSEFARLFYCEKNFNNIVKSYTILFDLTVVNQWHVITDGFVRVTSKAARLYFFSFHLLCVIVVLNIFVAFILEAFMLQYSLSEGHFEAAFEKKIGVKGRAESRADAIPSENSINSPTGSLQRLDADFGISQYTQETGYTFRLRKNRTKNAERLLQQMFEDELDEQGRVGAEFFQDENVVDSEDGHHVTSGNNDDDDDDVDHDTLLERVEQQELRSPRKLTLETVDFV